MIILFAILLSAFSKVSPEKNILLKNPISTSENVIKAVNINDGNTRTCFEFQSSKVKWAVIDLKRIFEVQNFVITIKKNKQNIPISIYVGDSFMPCLFHTQKETYKLCTSGILSSEKSELKCQKSGVVGQYVALILGNSSIIESHEKLNLCEFEGVGKLIPNGTPKKRPEIKSKSLKPISEYHFEISKQIRKNVPFITMPMYSNSIHFINENCGPILYVPEKYSSFGVACQTENKKGRITVFGKKNFLYEVIKNKNMSELHINLLKWLSPKKLSGITIINSGDLKSLVDLKRYVKNGDIVNFDANLPVQNDILQELKQMLLNGSIGINIDDTFWVGNRPPEARNSYMEILNIFNVDFSMKFLNWDKDTKFALSDKDYNEDFLGLDQYFLRFSDNHDYFLKMAHVVSSMMDDIPTHIISNSKLRQPLMALINKYYELLKWICPCKANPLSDVNDRRIVQALSTVIKYQLLINSDIKIPCVDQFPGDFSKQPPKVDVTINIKSLTPYTLHPIGYYLAPGNTLNYNILNVKEQWSMRVGCHSDILNDGRPEWYRYPTIYVPNVPLENKGSVYSPFGGVLWLHSEKENASISITLTNVVATPFFNTRDQSSISQWNKNKNSDGLWAQIAGSNIVFCVESNKIKRFNESHLYNVMNMWDLLIKSDHYLKSIDWKSRRPEMAVLDIMTSAGYGHSGYPISLYDDWFEDIFDMDKIKREGNWGMCHEIGHNMQESSWTFDGTWEVTNNLFCLYNYKNIWNLNYFGSDQLKIEDRIKISDIQKYLDTGANFKTWQSEAFHALLIYAQIANHFGFGFYKEVFLYYKINKMEFKDENEKTAMWLNVTSIVSKQNLLPLFEYWGFPISNSLKKTLNHLPCFFPNDFYINISKKRANYINSKYKNCEKKAKFFKDVSIKELNRESLPNFIHILNVRNH